MDLRGQGFQPVLSLVQNGLEALATQVAAFLLESAKLAPMADPLHQIDYAPPCRRPAWLTGRTASIALLAIAAMASGWVVIPRVSQRAQHLTAQRALLEQTYPVEPFASRSFPDEHGAFMHHGVPEVVDRVKSWVFAAGVGGGVAFAGERSSHPANKRLLIVEAQLVTDIRLAPDLTLMTYVADRGGWYRTPSPISTQTHGPVHLPFPAGGCVIVRPGYSDSADASRFFIPVEFTSALVTSDPSTWSNFVPELSVVIVAHLMADDSVRIDWPTESIPVR